MRARWLLAGALLLALAHGALHLAGGRGAVGVLSGTWGGDGLDLLLGAAYAASWLAFVLCAPVLALGAVLLHLVARLAARAAARAGPSARRPGLRRRRGALSAPRAGAR